MIHRNAGGSQPPTLSGPPKESHVSGNYGFPPAGTKVAAIVSARLDEVRKTPSHEMIRVAWRGEQVDLDVITMPLSQVYLNPSTHRIRAQRSLDEVRDEHLEANPWSDEGQLYLSDLLKAKPDALGARDPDYEELMEQLKEDGQLQAGVMTHNGVLVDANTRAVALRELGRQDIRVGILPEDADWSDINRLELRIQLRKDKRRDYLYINRLDAIEEQLALGASERDVAREWKLQEKSLKADRWAYGIMKEAVKRSKTGDGKHLTLMYFNDQQESFREFYRHYTQLAATDPDGAERLKEARLAAIVLGVPKTSLRHIKGDFYSRFLEPQLPEPLKPQPTQAETLSVPGFDDLDLSTGDDSEEQALRQLADDLLKATTVQVSGEDGSEIRKAQQQLQATNGAFREAVKFAGMDATLSKKQTAVHDRITEAASYIAQSVHEFARSKADRTLDDEGFDDALLSLRESMLALAKVARRTYTSPDEGVEWLLDAVRGD